MNAPLDDAVVQRVNDLGGTRWTGATWRHTARRRDPLSGTGARLHGGRWNPPELFGALYLAEPVKACLLELERLAATQAVDVDTFLRAPRTLHTITATDVQLLDLRTDEALDQVGLRHEDIHDDDRTACQSVGHAAWFLELTGVIAPSATGYGHVITVFESRVQPGQLTVSDSSPLDSTRYANLMSQ